MIFTVFETDRQTGQDLAIGCNEVKPMPDKIDPEARIYIQRVLERQLNDYLYEHGHITKALYDAVKNDIDSTTEESSP